MDQRLIDASKAGDVDALYEFLGEDQYVLESIDLAPFENTPLHLAVEGGMTDFAVEITNLKPSFTRKLNQSGFSPIHLASTYGHLDIVHQLLSKDHDLCLLQGRGNRISLHFAAMAGKIDVMKVLLKASPDSIEKLTVAKETALHLAARNGQVEACKVLLEWLKQVNKRELLNWKDKDGNTALELTGSPEVLELLEIIQVTNTNGHRTERQGKIVVVLLWETWRFLFPVDKKAPMPSDMRNVLLVVAILIATTTFQAGLSPTGGVWQDNCTNSTTAATSTGRNQLPHYAGQVVMRGFFFPLFSLVNTRILRFTR